MSSWTNADPLFAAAIDPKLGRPDLSFAGWHLSLRSHLWMPGLMTPLQGPAPLSNTAALTQLDSPHSRALGCIFERLPSSPQDCADRIICV